MRVIQNRHNRKKSSTPTLREHDQQCVELKHRNSAQQSNTHIIKNSSSSNNKRLTQNNNITDTKTQVKQHQRLFTIAVNFDKKKHKSTSPKSINQDKTQTQTHSRDTTAHNKHRTTHTKSTRTTINTITLTTNRLK